MGLDGISNSEHETGHFLRLAMTAKPTSQQAFRPQDAEILYTFLHEKLWAQCNSR